MSESQNTPDAPIADVEARDNIDGSPNIISPDEARAQEVSQLVAEVRSRVLNIIIGRLRKKPRHFTRPDVDVSELRTLLENHPSILDSLSCMEESGGAPDIVKVYKDSFLFADCSPESPEKRRGMDFCGVTGSVEKFNVNLMPKELYKAMQKIGIFDEGSSSVIQTPNELIQSGYIWTGFRGNKGATFVNTGIEKKSADRGWRGVLSLPRVKKTK